MIAAYTVCSANDLARAKTFAHSLWEHEPGIILYIGLTDKIDGRFDPQELAPAKIIEASELNLPELDQMSSYYTVTELNCAMKSFFGSHILQMVKPQLLLYFDTDIFIYQPLAKIREALEAASIVLTPHIQSPIPPDGRRPRERDMLAAGMFNGGFIGFRNNETVHEFFRWWKERMVDQAFIRPGDGMFYDQNWLNFAPLYFKDVVVMKDAGHNVAYWNLHERQIEKQDGRFSVNGMPLTFFHFSGLDPRNDQISKHQDRFDTTISPALNELFAAYKEKLNANGFGRFSQLACAYGRKPKKHSASKKLLMHFFGALGYEIKKTAR